MKQKISNAVDVQQEVDKYGKLKAVESELSAEIKETKGYISTYMETNDLSELSGEEFTFKIARTTKSDFDTEKLISIIKEEGIEGVIELKEYVNMEELEKLVYEGKVNASIIAPAKVVSYGKRMTVKKNGGNK